MREGGRGIVGPALATVLFLASSATGATARCSVIDHDHAAWSVILGRVVAEGQVDYTGLRAGARDLDAYLSMLSDACGPDYEGWTPPQRLAFWINAYNAFTVRLILDHYPVASIRRIGWLPGAAFRTRFIPMAGLKGRTISLDEIEHGTLRSAFHEPRIHFALVCAARSCPSLRSEAYRAADLDAQLDDQARRFLGDPAKNRVDVAARTLYLSSIFRWFRDDFETGGRTLASYVDRWLEPEVSGFEVRFLDYDWRLNDRTGGAHP